MASGNVPQTEDGTIRKDLDDQVKALTNSLGASQTDAINALETELNNVKEKVNGLSGTLREAQTVFSKGNGSGFIIFFIMV